MAFSFDSTPYMDVGIPRMYAACMLRLPGPHISAAAALRVEQCKGVQYKL
jgi:hypothetical protein